MRVFTQQYEEEIGKNKRLINLKCNHQWNICQRDCKYQETE